MSPYRLQYNESESNINKYNFFYKSTKHVKILSVCWKCSIIFEKLNIKKRKLLFCIMYKFHNSYFNFCIIFVILYFISLYFYIFIYLFNYLIIMLFIYMYIYIYHLPGITSTWVSCNITRVSSPPRYLRTARWRKWRAGRGEEARRFLAMNVSLRRSLTRLLRKCLRRPLRRSFGAHQPVKSEVIWKRWKYINIKQ